MKDNQEKNEDYVKSNNKKKQEERRRQEHQVALQQAARHEQVRIRNDMERASQLRTKQRQYPRNQELWREVVLLLNAVSQLEKEEKLWHGPFI
jgi:hypothetical protein